MSGDDKAAAVPLATGGHLARAVQLASIWLVAGLLPERFWWPLARAWGGMKVALGLGRTAWRLERLATIFGDHVPSGARGSVVADSFAHDIVSHLQRARENWLWPWRRGVRVIGAEHVVAALAEGRGAVLWVSRFTYSDLLTKRGMAQAGLRAYHVSRSSHGFTGSRLAARFLDPFWVGPEARHLAARVVIGEDANATRTLRRQLKANQVVSITMGHVGARWCFSPFLEGWMIQATGPANLALAAGAPLLPVFTTKNAAGGFDVHIDSPLTVPEEGAREARFQAMADEMLRRLEVHARAHPAQYMFWRGRFERAPYDSKADPDQSET